MRPRRLVVRLVVPVLVVWFSAFASADEVTDAANEALEHYRNKNYSEAAAAFDYAAQLARQKRGAELERFLPRPLAGWEAQDAKSTAVGAAMLGGMVSAEREYRKGESSVTVTIVTDSPMIAGVTMMLSNPMFATSEGGKLRTIGGQKAIVKFDASDRSGEIQVVAGGRYLVTVKGSSVEEKDLVDYAAAVDFKGLATP
jgi:hypothetical protein